jgi:hypothetical protein
LRKFVKARLTFRISDFWATKTTVSWLFEAIRQTGTSSRRETLNPKRAGYEAHIESLKGHIKNGKRGEMKKPSEGLKKFCTVRQRNNARKKLSRKGIRNSSIRLHKKCKKLLYAKTKEKKGAFLLEVFAGT